MVMIFSGAANVGFWMLLSAFTADVQDVDAERHGERRELLFAVPTTLLVAIALFLFRRYDAITPASGRHAGAREGHVMVPCEVR